MLHYEHTVGGYDRISLNADAVAWKSGCSMMRDGEREVGQVAADCVDGRVCADAVARVVAVEFQRGLCVGFLRGRVFQPAHGVVAAAGNDGFDGRGA